MPKRNRLPQTFFLTLAALALTGCDASDDDARTLFGTAVDVGDGTARSYVEMDASGKVINGGWLSDKLGGARVTFWNFILMALLLTISNRARAPR